MGGGSRRLLVSLTDHAQLGQNQHSRALIPTTVAHDGLAPFGQALIIFGHLAVWVYKIVTRRAET